MLYSINKTSQFAIFIANCLFLYFYNKFIFLYIYGKFKNLAIFYLARFSILLIFYKHVPNCNIFYSPVLNVPIFYRQLRTCTWFDIKCYTQIQLGKTFIFPDKLQKRDLFSKPFNSAQLFESNQHYALKIKDVAIWLD